MATNEQDVRALTYLAMRLRANTLDAGPWDEPGTYDSVKKLLGQNLAISIERVCRNAGDPKAKTPGAIHRRFTPPPPEDGPERNHPPKRTEVCTVPGHEGYRADACAGCHSDRLADDDELKPAMRPLPRGDASHGADLVRQAAGWATNELEESA